MVINRKGWYINDKSNAFGVDITYKTSKNTLEGTKIDIYKTSRGYLVQTFGNLMNIKQKTFNTLQKAEAYARKVMRFHDYGARQLNVLKSD